MTPAARIQAAIEVIDIWFAGDEGIDKCLLRWGRSHRFAGSGDRRAIADLVYDAVRRLRSSAWVAGCNEATNGRDVLRGSLVLSDLDPKEFFSGLKHAPAPLTAEEGTYSLDAAPVAVICDIPDWMGALADQAQFQALRARAPLDLRVNTLRSTIEKAVLKLNGEGIEVEEVTAVPGALRVVKGARGLNRSKTFSEGLVEVQDAGSQAAAAFAKATDGLVLDLCAGGGGKTLALAAQTSVRGRRLIAHDISAERMTDLPARAKRAGAAGEIRKPGQLQDLKGACDIVVVDAPCSGSGAWRRNPDAKWRLTNATLAEFETVQRDLLNQAATLCAPSGGIVYMTCSIFERENTSRVSDFLAVNSDFVLDEMIALPVGAPGDGFFVARLLRAPTI